MDKLRGGDRRSLGEVVAAVGKTPALFTELFACLFDDDPVVRMRAADAVEKVSSAGLCRRCEAGGGCCWNGLDRRNRLSYLAREHAQN